MMLALFAALSSCKNDDFTPATGNTTRKSNFFMQRHSILRSSISIYLYIRLKAVIQQQR